MEIGECPTDIQTGRKKELFAIVLLLLKEMDINR